MQDETRPLGPGGRIHGPGSVPEKDPIGGTMEDQEDALETSLMPGADPERLRFGVEPPPPGMESTIAPSPMDRPVGMAGVNQAAREDPLGPDPDVLRNVEAGTDAAMMPPTVDTSSGERLNRPVSPPSPAAPEASRIGAPPRPVPPEAAVVEAQDLMGRPVVTLAEGKVAGHIKDVVFDPEGERLSGFTVSLPGLLGGTRLLRWHGVHAIGQDAVTVESVSALEPERREKPRKDSQEDAREDPLEDAVEHGPTVLGKRILTEEGNTLGTVEDLVVDRRTGEVLGYRLRGHKDEGGRYLPLAHTIAVGDDVITVPAYAGEYGRSDANDLAAARRLMRERGA